MNLLQFKGKSPVESGHPLSALTLDLTERCNLACSYCFAHTHKGGAEKDLDFETAKKVVDWFLLPEVSGNNKKLELSFWGGEPFLKWELMQQIVLYAEEQAAKVGKRFVFGGTTNVTLLTPEKFDFLDKHGIFFLLSIDGTKKTHDFHRKTPNGKGSWALVDKNATEILKKWPFYKARLSFSAENIHRMLKDLQYLHSKGFKDIAYSVVAEGNWTKGKLELLKKSWWDIARWYVDLHKSGERLFLKYVDDPVKHLNGQPMGDVPPCGAGRSYVGISIEGAIYPCHRFHKYDDLRPWYEQETCLGHIEHGILNHDFRSRFVGWKPEDSECDLIDCKCAKVICTGGCWATNLDMCGDIAVNPEVSCYVNKLNFEVAEWVLSQFKENNLTKFDVPTVSKIVKNQGDGCICYNTEHRGRILIDRTNPQVRCVCNAANYYDEIDHPYNGCVCYNSCNLEGTDGEISYRDQSGASCRIFNDSLPNKPVADEKILDLDDLSSIDYLISVLEKQVEGIEKEKRERENRLSKLRELKSRVGRN